MPSPKRIRTRPQTAEESSRWASPAPVIASNDDLLSEILVRLPVKSLLRFKSVSKQWLSLISDPHFIRRKSLQPNAVSALYAQTFHQQSDAFDYRIVPLHLMQREAPLTSITLDDPPHSVAIICSSSGLLLCSSSLELNSSECKYYVYNPTTKQFRTLPSPRGQATDVEVMGFCLALDPPKSPGYKVACIQRSASSYDHCQILVYSSETGDWRVSGAPFRLPRSVWFYNGVYCNGAIYWVSAFGDLLRFDLEKELAYELPMPPNYSTGREIKIAYFGESGGHLHLVESYDSQFMVYEMKSDRTGWFVKFQVDVTVAVRPAGLNMCGFQVCNCPHVLWVARGEKEGDSFLLMLVRGKIIRYNFRNQIHQVIHRTDRRRKLIQRNLTKQTCEVIGTTNNKTRPIGWPCVYPHMDSISLV